MPGSIRLLLAAGLVVSAVLLAAIGGGWGLAIGAGQAAVTVAILVAPGPTPMGAAVLVLIPAPLAAVRHWTARLPGACHCARLSQPPPGLVSLTGLIVALDVGLLGMALWLISSHRKAGVGKSSP